MPRKTLTDRTLKSLKPIFPQGHERAGKRLKAGEAFDVMDAVVPGFGVRVLDSGRVTFILVARYPGSLNPTRRAIGKTGAISLEDARAKAREWLALIQKGIDPQERQKQEREAQQRKRDNSFRNVAEAFIADKLAKERRGPQAARDIRKNLLQVWGGLPVTEITDDQIAALIKAKARVAPVMAKNLLAITKRLLQWAVDQRCYDLKISPAIMLKPAALCGEFVPRDRLLSDDETYAFWRAASRLPYPYRQIYELLALTGLRVNEVVDASWGEFAPVVVRALRERMSGRVNWDRIDPKYLVWTIPRERMKGKANKARPHAIPLTADMLAVLETLPTFQRGEFLFSLDFGQSSVWLTSKVKRRLDVRMLRALQAMARQRGDDPKRIKLEPWVTHDLRRVVRSGLSRLRIDEVVREAVLAHVRPGIKGVYDVHDYLDEKREALMAWNARLRSIVDPPPANVVSIARA